MISKNKVPRVSANPPRFPAIEKLWQGNPPVIQSMCPLSRTNCRICPSVHCVMSCNSSSLVVSYIALYDCLAYLSISQNATHSCPFISIPVRNPPISSEEHTSELQSRFDLVCRILLKNNLYT